MKRLILPFLLLFTLVTIAADREAPHGEGHPSFSDAEHWAAIWDDAGRREWQKPIEVLGLLGVQDGEIVADLGAGTGYFTGLLSLQVGDSGRVYAVDIEPSLLAYIEERPDVMADRVTTVLVDSNDPGLPEGEIDLVLAVNTWHHIPKRSKYIKRLARTLSDSGRVAIIDYREGELPCGPPPEMRVPRAEVIAEFEKAGWSFVSESRMLPYQYFLTFYPPER